MDIKELQNCIISCICHSYIPKQQKIDILNYLFYQLCWDFDICDWLKIDI